MFPLRSIVVLALLAACSDYEFHGEKKAGQGDGGNDTGVTDTDDPNTHPPGECATLDFPAVEVGIGDQCPEPPTGGFTPVVEWEHGSGGGCLSLPAVGDLDGDGMPEVVYNQTDLFGGAGTLYALRGDGSGVLWTQAAAKLGYGSGPVLADLDNNGSPEVLGVREYSSSMFGDGDYTVVAFDATGQEKWESDHFPGMDFDYASAISVSDMDHDGSPEIVAGRVILDSQGNTRGVGEHGRGSYGITEVFGFYISEASVSAVTDLDLDGVEEVVVGNAMYDADGTTIWHDASADDGMIGIANLDADPEGEFLAVTGNTLRAVDTDGTVMWGPTPIPSANILSPPAVADIDLDGHPEIVVAGGNRIVAFNHDGSQLWTAPVTDESGATGASIFDFDGDGEPEVVYIDEVEMVVYAGPTGAVDFYSTEHASNTMMDYPVVADVDADDQAEIVVCHNGHSSAISVYGEKDGTWATARRVWNQHPYGISNVNDDLSVPVEAVPNFVDTNTWHSAIATTGEGLVMDLEPEVLDVCTEECAEGRVFVTLRVRNLSPEALAAGASTALYAANATEQWLLSADLSTAAIDAGWTGEAFVLELDASELAGADRLVFVVDDDGTGTGVLDECSEVNNAVLYTGDLCEN